MKESTEETIKAYILMHQNDLYCLTYNSDDTLDIVQKSAYFTVTVDHEIKLIIK